MRIGKKDVEENLTFNFLFDPYTKKIFLNGSLNVEKS